jgi:hypothetical protein
MDRFIQAPYNLDNEIEHILAVNIYTTQRPYYTEQNYGVTSLESKDLKSQIMNASRSLLSCHLSKEGSNWACDGSSISKNITQSLPKQ